MSFFLLPVSLVVKQYFFIFTSYLSQPSLYILILILLFSLIFGRKIYYRKIVNSRIILFSLLLLSLQSIAILISYMDIGNNQLNQSPIIMWFDLVIFISTTFIYYCIVKVLIQNIRDISLFFKGAFIGFIGLSVICYIQLIYIFTKGTMSSFVENIAKLFEQRANREWYDEGSYVQTLGRINAIYQESGYLATLIVVIFASIIIASIKNEYNLFFLNNKYNKVLYYTLLFNIIILLFFIQSTTGLLGIIIILLFLFKELPLKHKVAYSILIFISVAVFIILAKDSVYIQDTLNSLVFEKNESSTDNRFGGTIALITTWLTHFFLGVGWGYEDYYLFKYAPQWSKDNYEYINYFLVEGFYPTLSIFFGWLANFGSIIFVLVSLYIFRLLKSLKEYEKLAKILFQFDDYKRVRTINDFAKYFIILYFAFSILSFEWFKPYYIIVFFFIIVYRQLLKEQVSKKKTMNRGINS